MNATARIAACMLMAVLFSRVDAASVAWDQHDMGWIPEDSGGLLFTWGGVIPLLSHTKVGSAIVVWANMNISYNLAWHSAVVIANYGDTISAEYFNSQTEFFYDDLYYVSQEGDPPARTDYPIVVEPGKSVFLAMDKRSLTGNPEKPYYGWAEIFIDDDGEVAIATSATDIDGDPITIRYRDDLVPEPSSVLLLLAGGALLLLRRPRGLGSTPLATAASATPREALPLISHCSS